MMTFLLDGLWGSPARLSFLAENLKRHGCDQVEIFAYRASGFACLEQEALKLAHRVRREPAPVNLVGYSMGGLVARAASLVDASLSVRRLVCVNTPHRGSILARLLPGKAFRQMRPESSFISRLDAQASGIPCLAIWTPGDLMVIPATSARWERASVVERCNFPAHIWPLFSARLHRRIAKFILRE